jgi:hypothetical protein
LERRRQRIAVNCAAIEIWENRGGTAVISWLAALVAVAACLLLAVRRSPLLQAELISAAAFPVLHSARHNLSKNALRVLADVALLSPIILLLLPEA